MSIMEQMLRDCRGQSWLPPQHTSAVFDGKATGIQDRIYRRVPVAFYLGSEEFLQLRADRNWSDHMHGERGSWGFRGVPLYEVAADKHYGVVWEIR